MGVSAAASAVPGLSLGTGAPPTGGGSIDDAGDTGCSGSGVDAVAGTLRAQYVADPGFTSMAKSAIFWKTVERATFSSRAVASRFPL